MILASTDYTGIALVITSVLAGVAAVLGGVAAIITARGTARKLETKNGLTVGQMVQHGYSMAAQLVPADVRTAEQDEAVAMLTDQEHRTHAEGQGP